MNAETQFWSQLANTTAKEREQCHTIRTAWVLWRVRGIMRDEGLKYVQIICERPALAFLQRLATTSRFMAMPFEMTQSAMEKALFFHYGHIYGRATDGDLQINRHMGDLILHVHASNEDRPHFMMTKVFQFNLEDSKFQFADPWAKRLVALQRECDGFVAGEVKRRGRAMK